MDTQVKLNRLANCKNPFQGSAKKVLVVCSAGLLRSPTAAWVLSNEPYLYNTRAAGIDDDFALIVVDDVLLEWADEIVCMDKSHQRELRTMPQKPIKLLNLPDKYPRMHPELIKAIKNAYKP